MISASIASESHSPIGLAQGGRRADGARRPGKSLDRVIAALGELIDALDRRLPQVERVGEIRIVREAGILRSEAVIRIGELKRARSNRHIYDAKLADAVMTDDGAPTRACRRRERR